MATSATLKPSVFLSLRFGESMHIAELLKRDLERKGASTFLCDIPEGKDIAGAISASLDTCVSFIYVLLTIITLCTVQGVNPR